MLMMLAFACKIGIDEDLSSYETGSDSQGCSPVEEDPYNGVDDDCNPATLDDDLDADGFRKVDDCNDNDASINPDAEEAWYDGIDQNCDDANDFDKDGDGYLWDGAVDGDDCNDEDAEVNPGSLEIWYDGKDQDCDNADDYDQDGDGHVAAEEGGDDCDDVNASTHPGADEVDCRDGVLNDCNSSPEELWDECGPNGSVGIEGIGRVTTIYGAISGDNAGLSVAALGNGLLAIAAPNSSLYGGASSKRGSVYVVSDSGASETFLGDSTSYIARISEEGTGGDEFGWRVARAYDVNGDGLDEFMVSSRTYGNDEGGTVYLISGAITGDLDLSDSVALATSPYVFSIVRNEGLDDSFGHTAVIVEVEVILTRHSRTPSPKTGIVQV